RRDCEPVFQADCDHLWRALHAPPVRVVYDFGSCEYEKAPGPTSGQETARRIQSRSPTADRYAELACAPRKRIGGPARLPVHGAPEESPAKDEPPPARYRGDDRAYNLYGRGRI